MKIVGFYILKYVANSTNLVQKMESTKDVKKNVVSSTQMLAKTLLNIEPAVTKNVDSSI